jgi:FAD/FMN-containing dehydrogenases
LGNVIKTISSYNISLPTGSCVNTGTAGLSLGAGISPSLIRLSGLMADHIVSAKMINSNGEIINIDENENSDLLFAIKGAGGGNFGIFTEFTFHPCWFKGAIVFNLRYDWSVFKKVFKMWQKFSPFTDRNLSSEIDLFPPKFSTDETPPVQFKGQYEGSLSDLKKLIKPFIDLVKKTKKSTIFIKHAKTFAEAGKFWGETVQTYFENYSIFWQNSLSDEALDVYDHYMKIAPGPYSSIEFNAMMGRVSDIKSNETAFPYRKSRFWNQLQGKSIDPEDFPKQQLWVRKLYDAISVYADKNHDVVPSYINAPQKNLQDKYMRAYYSTNSKKLIKIKNKYDPENFFHFPQSIPLSDDTSKY